MRLQHSMPYGAEVLTDGGVRFSLWAPAAQSVDLCLKDGADTILLPLEPSGQGWFQLITNAAHAGSRYYYRINGDRCIPDPASRFQPDDVHGASEVVDPQVFTWQDSDWRGRPWETAVIYELHIGSFTPQGTFAAIKAHLDHLLELGVTALVRNRLRVNRDLAWQTGYRIGRPPVHAGPESPR